MSEKKFYVYALLDPRKPGEYRYGFGESELRFAYEPFYIGKGTGDRWKHHFRKAKVTNFLKHNKIKKLQTLGLEPGVSFLIEAPNEDLVFCVEEEAIDTVGRQVDKQGPLTNLIRGGTGGTGFSWTDEMRKNKSEGSKKMWADPEFHERVSRSHQTRCNVEGYAAKKSAEQIRAWEEPGARERRTASAVKNGARPEFREKMRQINSARYEDPVYRENSRLVLLAAVRDPINIQRQSERLLALYANPAERVKMSESCIRYRWEVEEPHGGVAVVYRLQAYCDVRGLKKAGLLSTHAGRQKATGAGYKVVGRSELPANWRETSLYEEYLNLEALYGSA